MQDSLDGGSASDPPLSSGSSVDTYPLSEEVQPGEAHKIKDGDSSISKTTSKWTLLELKKLVSRDSDHLLAKYIEAKNKGKPQVYIENL